MSTISHIRINYEISLYNTIITGTYGEVILDNVKGLIIIK